MGRRKPGKPRKGRASEQGITRRRLRIYQKGDQIKALSGDRWDVTSQDAKGVWCRVSFAGGSPTCKCAYHATGKGCRCKHIAAVEHALLISSEAALGRKIDIGEQDLACPDCGAKKYSRDGWYATAGTRRGRGTSASHASGGSGDNPGFEYRQVPRPYIITLAPMLPGMGMAVAGVQMTLKHLGRYGCMRTP